MNDAWRLAPWADVLYACDLRWWAAKRPGPTDRAPPIRVSQDSTACDRYGLTYVHSVAAPGLGVAPWTIHQGLNSGYQALNLAYHLGAQRVLLLGYDMQRTDGRSHWFGDHPRGLQVASPYDKFVDCFNTIAPELSERGIRVINCSDQTALSCFERLPIYVELE